MIDAIAEKLFDPRFMGTLLTAIAAAATAFAVAQPFFESDKLSKRMKLVSDERELIRRRERQADRARPNERATLRVAPKAYMKSIVDRYQLHRWIDASYLMRIGMVIGAAYTGIKAPELFLVNTAKKRQAEIRRAWPDALDLTLICVESGMAIENAFRKVSTEIAASSVVLAEELALMTAEMSFLPDRRQAYENLVMRTGLEPVKSVATPLIQAERYGTPIGQALRVLSQESRDQRMNEAEKKAASLPPKLTVPMILFFLPVLFVVIITPAVIQVMRTQ